VNAVGPFEAAQRRLYWGHAIPIVAGWFGEINKEFRDLIKRLALLEATTGGLFLGALQI